MNDLLETLGRLVVGLVFICCLAAIVYLLLSPAPADTGPTYQQQAVTMCQHRGGINQLSIEDSFAICKDGTLHNLRSY